MKSTKTERTVIEVLYNDVLYKLPTTINYVDKSIWVDCPTDNSMIIEILNEVLEETFKVKIKEGRIKHIRNSHKKLNYEYTYSCKYTL